MYACACARKMHELPDVQRFQADVRLHEQVLPSACSCDVMFIVRRGLALCAANVLRAGAVMGSDILLTDPGLRTKHRPCALTYLEVI